MYLASEKKCPYCHNKLNNIPKRKRKCKKCNSSYNVVTRPSDKKRVAVTEKEWKKLKERWRKVARRSAALRGLKDGLSRFFDGREYLETVMEKEKHELRKRFSKNPEDIIKKYGIEPSDHDALWSIANKLVLKFGKLGDFSTLSGIYFDMALFLHQSEKPNSESLRISNRMRLMGSRNSEYIKGVEIDAKWCCDYCKPLDGKILSIKEALETEPLPQELCTHKLTSRAPEAWCLCTYLEVVKF